MRTLFTLIFLLLSSQAFSQVFVIGEGGYFNLRQQKAMSNSVSPTGVSFGGGVGYRSDFYDLEATFFKTRAEDDVIHDDVKNKMVHEQSSLRFAFNFYFTKRFFARLGYGLNRIDQKLKNTVSTASEEGAKKSYGLVQDKFTDGPMFGAGLVLFERRSFALFTQIEYQNFSSIESGAWNSSIGIRFYFPKN